MATIKGKGAPTRNTAGAVGDFYIDTDTRNTYECKFACKMSFRDPEYEWYPTDKIPVSYEEEKTVSEPEPEVTEVEKEDEEVVQPVEESKPNYTNYSNKSRNNYNKQYRK